MVRADAARPQRVIDGLRFVPGHQPDRDLSLLVDDPAGDPFTMVVDDVDSHAILGPAVHILDRAGEQARMAQANRLVAPALQDDLGGPGVQGQGAISRLRLVASTSSWGVCLKPDFFRLARIWSRILARLSLLSLSRTALRK